MALPSSTDPEILRALQEAPGEDALEEAPDPQSEIASLATQIADLAAQLQALVGGGPPEAV